MDFMDVEKLKNSLKSALNEIAKPIANTPFTRENYNRLFPYSRIKTPTSMQINGKNKAVQSVVVAIEDENVSILTHERGINNVVNKIKKPEQLIYTSDEVGQLIERITGKRLVTVNPTRVNENSVPPLPNIPQPAEKSSMELMREWER